MKSLALLVIGLLAGALCALAAVNALSKRGAHGRAAMIVLAHHLDELRATRGDAECASGETRNRLEQIAFAVREIDYAFDDLIKREPAFARRSADLRHLAERPVSISSCAELDRTIGELGDSCQACHRRFR